MHSSRMRHEPRNSVSYKSFSSSLCCSSLCLCWLAINVEGGKGSLSRHQGPRGIHIILCTWFLYAMTAQANPLEGQWRKALEQLKTWNESRDRALAHLNSINNLAGQLETLHRCRSGGCGPHRRDRHLGVVGERPLCVELLESKLVQAMEKAYACAVKEK